MKDHRRDLPSVSTLLESAQVKALLDVHPRTVVVSAVRRAVDSVRRTAGPSETDFDWPARIQAEVEVGTQRSLRPVLNGTGVILHTNLGRAPLAESAIHAIVNVASGFSNLEYDLEKGQRGSRYSHCVSLLRDLTGAEGALVVNNCAAALVLSLNALAQKKEVLVSRGELVEIGGSFRIPDIMGRSGAKLVEVGTTNRTHDDDYRRAITPKTAAIVKVHRSNFAIEGFTADVPIDRLAFIAAEHGIPVINDLGSGLMISLERYGLGGEPTASEALAAGADLVLMSGDKLLGGPQAGIILGAAAVIAKLRKNPFARAFRVDKLTLSALEATLRLYLEPETAIKQVPVLAMLTAPAEEIGTRAERIVDTLRGRGIAAKVVPSVASVGGGAFPTARIQSSAVSLEGSATEWERALRSGAMPVVGRIEDDALLLDLRSILPSQDEDLSNAIISALA